MALANKDEFLEYVSGLTVIELVDHIEAMEEKFGVTAAAAAVAVAPGAGGGADAPAEEPAAEVADAPTAEASLEEASE